MTPELTVLALAGLLQSAQFATMAIPANRELGLARTMARRATTGRCPSTSRPARPGSPAP